MTKHEIEPMRIGASAVQMIAQSIWDKFMSDVPRGGAYDKMRKRREERARKELDEFRLDCIPDLTVDQLVALVTDAACLCGYSDTGFTYHNAPAHVVGAYMPERDDSLTPGWLQPVWVQEDEDTWFLTMDGAIAIGWGPTEFAAHRAMTLASANGVTVANIPDAAALPVGFVPAEPGDTADQLRERLEANTDDDTTAGEDEPEPEHDDGEECDCESPEDPLGLGDRDA